MNDDEELIHSYSRAQAIADGVLVDVSALAKQAGIKYPTAVTQAVFEQYVRVPSGVSDQDETGRIWDLLRMLQVAIQEAHRNTDSLHFRVAVKVFESAAAVPVSLRALCHPGDDGEPVITILLPHQD